VCSELKLEALWQHSLSIGAAARAIALCENYTAAQAEELFLAAFLHDVGKVVFATRATSLADAPISAMTELVALMESHHAEVGAYLLGLWGFPNTIVEAVAFHHAPSRGSASGLSQAGIIHIADRLVHAHDGVDPNSISAGLEPGYLESLGLSHRLAKWSMAVSALDERKAVG
jgi:putative nucleotidyltransferase with HDIG domain